MKFALITLTAALWAGYALGHDCNPSPRWYRPAINLLYMALLVLEAMWL